MLKREVNLIDFMKGLSILLVVFGHSIQVNYTNFDEIFIFKLIYSFHMPMFIAISGYLAAKSLSLNGCSIEKCILQKAFFLLIPYFSWYVIILILEKKIVSFETLIDNFILLFHEVDRGLWFLYILFLLYGILYISYKFKYKYIILIFFILILPMNKFLGMHLLKWYLTFFIIGIIFFDLKNLVIFNYLRKTIDKAFIKFIIVILFIGSLFFWERVYEQDSIFLNLYYLFIYKFIVAVLGMIFIYIICKMIIGENNVSKIFTFFGKNSLRIYILNFLFLGYLRTLYLTENYIILIIISFFISFISIYVVDKLTTIYFFKILFGEIRNFNFKLNKSWSKNE